MRKILYNLFGVLLALFLVNGLTGQTGSHTMTINAPAGIAGAYEVVIGAFGPAYCDVDTLSGTLELVVDGGGGSWACDEVTNDLTGKIAVLDRGPQGNPCSFSVKVYNAQQRGAIGVLVVNYVPNELFVMGPGEFADQVTIPSFMISNEDGNVIKPELMNGVEVSFKRNAEIQDDFDGTVVWSDDFANGLANWTVRDLSCGNGSTFANLWRPAPLGEALNGGCGGTILVSPTRCNGAVSFESDFYDSNGAGCGGAAVGSGPCPAPQIGEIISPVIDLSGIPSEGYALRFYQDTRQFQSNYWVGWTTDGGMTWDSTLINTEIPGGGANESPVVTVPLANTANAQSLQFKFRYEANYYYWVIDDVQLILQSANDLRVNANFFAVPPNAQFPLSQSEPFPFLADIENVGAQDQSNVNLNVSIVDLGSSQIVYSDDLDYGTVPANSLVENNLFLQEYQADQLGIFGGVYTISADSSDADESNNQQVFFFEVTETAFAKEFGPTRFITPAPGNWDAGEPHSWAYGNFYHVVNGAGTFLRSIDFSIGNSDELAGRALLISLYKWVEDTNGDQQADPAEREALAFQIYEIQGTEQPTDVIELAFPEAGTDPIELEDETDYLVMVEYYTNDAVDMTLVANDEVDFTAQVFASQLLGKPRYASMLGVNGDLTVEPFSTIGFGRDLVPVVRMQVGNNPVSTNELEDIAREFTVFPNPANDLITVQLGLQEFAPQATIRLLDVSGRTILQRELENVQLDNFQFDIRSLTGGAYFLQLTTAEGTGTRRFMVNR